MKTIKLKEYKNDEILNKYTFRELYEDMISQIEHYKKLGMLDTLMESNISTEIVDKNCSVLYSLMNFSTGLLEGNLYHIQGSLNHIYSYNQGYENE